MGNYLYRRNGGTGYTNVHDIEYDVTNDIWQDASVVLPLGQLHLELQLQIVPQQIHNLMDQL